MKTMRRASVAGLLALTFIVDGCGLDVTRNENGARNGFNATGPAGVMSVRVEPEVAKDIGLQVYPGAVPAHDDGKNNADVKMYTRWFALKVAAAKFDADAAPADILTFYRRELSQYGPVAECPGQSCRDSSSSIASETQLSAGSKERRRIVVIKPRGTGSEFSMVYTQTWDGQ